MRIAAVSFALAFVACVDTASTVGPSDAALGPEAPDFGFVDPLSDVDASPAARVTRLFRGTCAGVGNETNCHARAAGGLTMNLSRDGGDVIGVPSLERPDLLRVSPGIPGASYLYLKVIGDGGIDGGRMPLGQTQFDPRLPTLIAMWIDAGAPVD